MNNLFINLRFNEKRSSRAVVWTMKRKFLTWNSQIKLLFGELISRHVYIVASLVQTPKCLPNFEIYIGIEYKNVTVANLKNIHNRKQQHFPKQHINQWNIAANLSKVTYESRIAIFKSFWLAVPTAAALFSVGNKFEIVLKWCICYRVCLSYKHANKRPP